MADFAFTLGRWLMRVRPAPLAVAMKHALFLRRRVVATPTGSFWLDPASDAGQRVAASGVYEPITMSLLGQLLRPGDTYVDVGANEGFLCVAAARLVGPAGRVIAVEPQARLQEVLRRNFALNGSRVDLVAAAVSDRAGTAQLHLSPSVNNSSTGLVAATRYRVPTATVPTLTLAQLLDQLGVTRPFVLKMDIESWEHEAILGSPEIFRANLVRALVLELHPELLARRGLDPQAVPRFLRECGYDHLPGSLGCAWMQPGATAP
jgi:FkbM family methyltransferase